MGQPIPSTDQLTEAYMRLALMRWIDQMPRPELEATFAKLPPTENSDEEEVDYDRLWEQFPPAPTDGSLALKGTVDYTAPTDENYARMAADEQREREALEWIEGVITPNEL